MSLTVVRFGWLVVGIAVSLTSNVSAEAGLADLGGITLRCCVVLERPYVFQEKKRFRGLAIKYLRDLEEALNFKCKIEKYTGEDDNRQGFTGLTQYFEDCADNGDSSRCICDIAASGFVRTPNRLPRVDFAAPFALDSFSVAQSTEEIKYPKSQLFFMKPFSIPVWIGVVSLIFSHTFVTLFDEHFKPPEKATLPPVHASWFSKIRHILLKTELLRRIRYALESS